MYHQGSAGNRNANHYFKSYPRFREAAQPKIAWGRRDPEGTRSPPRDRAQSGRGAPRRCVSRRKVLRGLGKNRIQLENRFFRAGTSIFSPWKPPKPTRTQSKTQPHRGTGRGGFQTTRSGPGHPRTSRSTGEIREPTRTGDKFFGARIEFSGSETPQNPPGTTRKPSLTVGRAGEAPRAPLEVSPTPPDV